jgi:hypothetical protein
MNRLFEVAHYLHASLRQPYFDHSPIVRAPLANNVLKALKAIEQSRHIRHLRYQLTGDVPARQPFRTYPL